MIVAGAKWAWRCALFYRLGRPRVQQNIRDHKASTRHRRVASPPTTNPARQKYRTVDAGRQDHYDSAAGGTPVVSTPDLLQGSGISCAARDGKVATSSGSPHDRRLRWPRSTPSSTRDQGNGQMNISGQTSTALLHLLSLFECDHLPPAPAHGCRTVQVRGADDGQ